MDVDLEYMASVSDMHSLPVPTASRVSELGSIPPLLHSTSLPVLPTEKKRKKIRLRSRSKAGIEDQQVSAQDESPFPGIPLHTVHKMPSGETAGSEAVIATTIIEKDGRGRDVWNTVTTTSSNVSGQSTPPRDTPFSTSSEELDKSNELGSVKPYRDDAQRHSSSSAESGAGEEDVHSSSEKEDALSVDDLSPDSRGRESGSEGGSSPTISHSPRKSSKDWKLKALTGRGIVNSDGALNCLRSSLDEGKEKEAISFDRSLSVSEAETIKFEKKQNSVLQVLHDYHSLSIPKPNQTTNFFIHKGLPSLR